MATFSVSAQDHPTQGILSHYGLKRPTFPGRPLWLPLPISLDPNHLVPTTRLGKAISSRSAWAPLHGICPRNLLLCPGQSSAQRSCVADVCQPCWGLHPCHLETLFLFPNRHLPICSIISDITAKPQQEGKPAVSHPLLGNSRDLPEHKGWGACLAVSTRLLPVGKAPATISFSSLQSPHLSPAPQLQFFKIQGLCPPLSSALHHGVFLLLISRPCSLVSSSPSSPFLHPSPLNSPVKGVEGMKFHGWG